MKDSKLWIFTKARTANAMAAVTISFTLYSVVFQQIDSTSLTFLAGISGFCAKHLWDSKND